MSRTFKGELLEMTSDKNGRPVFVFHSETMDRSEAYLFNLKAYAAMLESGKGDYCTPWEDNRCGIIYAKDETGKFLGNTVYDRKYLNNKVLWIPFEHVSAEERGKGIQKILSKHLHQIAKGMGCTRICAFVKSHNMEMNMATDSLEYERDTQLITKWLI